LALLLAAGIYGGWYLSVSADRMTADRVPSVPERLSSNPSTPTTTTPTVTSPTTVAPPAATTTSEQTATVGSTPATEDETAAPTESTTTAATSTDGQVYGAQHGDSRIAVVAKVDTWLRIEGPTGRVYINRNIKAGDSYKAPNVPGLVLIARDAGSVDLLVDGKSVGAAGPAGMVLTGMPLNPQFLLNRGQQSQE
jgi:cytoskeleton protein RodZ